MQVPRPSLPWDEAEGSQAAGGNNVADDEKRSRARECCMDGDSNENACC